MISFVKLMWHFSQYMATFPKRARKIRTNLFTNSYTALCQIPHYL